jgi:hypothetical protein
MLPEILQRVKAHGFAVFDGDHDYDLNIVGLRNPAGRINEFDDILYLAYKVDGEWVEHKFKCTTDPGKYWLRNPSRVAGTAIMMHPQQCRSVYKLDLHSGQYLALCQRNGKVRCWRDNNLNDVLDMEGDIHLGHGINIHRASKWHPSQVVEKYSAGCSVIQSPVDFSILIEAAKKQRDINGWDTFTYTLLLGVAEDFYNE